MATETHTHPDIIEQMNRRFDAIEARLDVMTHSLQLLTKWASNFPILHHQTLDKPPDMG